MTTLAQPFAPIRFQDEEPGHPFTEPAGYRGRVVTFESQYRSASNWNEGLIADLTFLTSTEWGRCAYGAQDWNIHGFLCDLPRSCTRLTDEDVLTALLVADFSRDLTQWPDTVWVNSEFRYQHMFENEEAAAEDGVHGELRRHVADKRLWYALLHIGGRPCDMVTLLAVGRSRYGERLVGGITRQVCHNLCD
jgi:hypothetical protein